MRNVLPPRIARESLLVKQRIMNFGGKAGKDFCKLVWYRILVACVFVCVYQTYACACVSVVCKITFFFYLLHTTTQTSKMQGGGYQVSVNFYECVSCGHIHKFSIQTHTVTHTTHTHSLEIAMEVALEGEGVGEEEEGGLGEGEGTCRARRTSSLLRARTRRLGVGKYTHTHIHTINTHTYTHTQTLFSYLNAQKFSGRAQALVPLTSALIQSLTPADDYFLLEGKEFNQVRTRLDCTVLLG